MWNSKSSRSCYFPHSCLRGAEAGIGQERLFGLKRSTRAKRGRRVAVVLYIYVGSMSGSARLALHPGNCWFPLLFNRRSNEAGACRGGVGRGVGPVPLGRASTTSNYKDAVVAMNSLRYKMQIGY